MSRGSNLTSEQIAKIYELAEQGMTQQRIAKEVGCTQATVSRRLIEWKGSGSTTTVDEFKRGKTLTPEEQADLIDMVADGYELEQLAPDFGCDVDTLAYYVRKHKRQESRDKERESKIVCGDKFSGLLLDRGNGDYHGTYRNVDGTFEHMDLHAFSRDDAKAEYEKWRGQMESRDEMYQAVFDKPKQEVEQKPETCGGRLFLVMQEAMSVVPFGDEDAALDLAAKVEALTGVRMTVREVAI